MKKNSLIILGVVVVAAFTAYGLSIKKSATVKEIATAEVVMDEVANEIMHTATSDPTKRIDFVYDIGPRFGGITKKALAEASSIHDFLEEEALSRMTRFQDLTVILIENDLQTNTRISGTTVDLTKAQKELLVSLKNSSSFSISAEFIERNEQTNELEQQHWRPHLTVVPEKQASYQYGFDKLKSYIETEIYEYAVDIDPKSLKPAKLSFTVAKDGTLKDLRLDRSSNYPEIDAQVKKILLSAPGTWQPAENEKGEKGAQELVVSFGMIGC